MGILADIFVASPAAASDYAASQLRGRAAHVAKYQPAEYKGLTSLEFGTLWALLAGEEWDVEKHMLEDISYGEGNESWLCRFPQPLVDLLAALSDTQVETYAAAWAKTDELAGAAVSDLQRIILDLRRLAKASKSSGKDMYLWGSL